MNQTLACNTTALIPGNLSCGPFPRASNDSNLDSRIFNIAFGSAIYILVVAFITVLANSLLLLVFWADPFKIFRSPTSIFLIGLAFADLVTGLIQEPIFASCFILAYLQNPASQHYCPQLVRLGSVLAAVTLNTSFIIVLALTVTQLIVIASPLKYAALVTKTKVVSAVLGTYAYTIGFGLLNLIEFRDPDTFAKIDLFLHSFFVVYLSIVFYILLYRAFRRQMASLGSLGEQRRANGAERRFVVMNLFLVVVVLICTQPVAIFSLYHYYWPHSETLASWTSRLMLDNILHSKFVVDPFVYAWRLPKHRHALRTVLPTVAA